MARALAVAGRDEKAALQQVVTADPGPGQVRVSVAAASVNGIDVAVAAGYVWDVMPHEFPVVLGRDFAGTVDAVGDGITDLRPGDRVAGTISGMTLYTGAITESVTLDAATVVPVPDGVTDSQAAALGLAALTAYDLVAALQLTPDDVVLVSGATGGVGGYAVQLAAGIGATVIATARPGEPTDFVLGLGANDAVDYTGDVAAAVRAVAPEGVTAIVHTAGDPATLGSLLRPGGRLASAVGATAEQVGRDDVTVEGVLASATREKVSALLDNTASGGLSAPVTRTYGLDDALQAIADFGGHKLGKLVVTVP